MITVLLTTYSDEKFLPNSIKSVLLQDFKDFELLIIDDGSQDDTYTVVKSFNDDRIKYVKIEHRGRSRALNYGLKEAKFDWVFLIDADDIILPHTLKKYSFFITLPQNTVVSSFASFYEYKKIVFFLDYPIKDDVIKQFLYLHSINNTVLYNRDFILNKMNGYDESLKDSEEDYELWLRAFKNLSFIIIPEYLIIKGFRLSSFSMRSSGLKKEKVYLLQNNFYNNMNLDSAILGYKLLGWRELFYGNKIKARVNFYKLGLRLIMHPKILLAIVVSYLPQEVLDRILLYNYYPRILYRFKYFSNDYKKIRSIYKKVRYEL